MDFAKLIALACLLFAPAADEQTNEPFPPPADCWPAPPIAPPAGSQNPVYDIYDNHWVLDGEHRLLVLPAQNPRTWIADSLSAAPRAAWKFLHPDEHGYLWIADAHQILRMDPREPSRGWEDFTKFVEHGEISAMATAPSGSILVALDSGKLAELDRIETAVVSTSSAPAHIQKLRTDGHGRIWTEAEGIVHRRAAPPDAWQRNWELVARLPGANHDLSGETIGASFYMAGGQTAAWGYPAKAHVFDALYEFNVKSRKWRVAATLTHPRFYNGTAALNAKLWVIAGGTRDADGTAHSLSTVEIYDPGAGEMKPGPALPFALEMPLAVHLANRLYVAGAGKLFSIAVGENSWRAEPDLPATAGLKAYAGTAFQDRFYIAIPKLGLAVFDPQQHAWRMADTTHQSRSAQIAAFQNKIWIMGGRDAGPGNGTMIFDPSSRKWQHGPDLPRDLSWGAAALVGDRLLITGGAAGRCYNNRTFLLRNP